jgi:hypothetical protein
MSFNWLVIRFNAGASAPLPETRGNQAAAPGFETRKSVLANRIVLAFGQRDLRPETDIRAGPSRYED